MPSCRTRGQFTRSELEKQGWTFTTTRYADCIIIEQDKHRALWDPKTQTICLEYEA